MSLLADVCAKAAKHIAAGEARRNKGGEDDGEVFMIGLGETLKLEGMAWVNSQWQRREGSSEWRPAMIVENFTALVDIAKEFHRIDPAKFDQDARQRFAQSLLRALAPSVADVALPHSVAVVNSGEVLSLYR